MEGPLRFHVPKEDYVRCGVCDGLILDDEEVKMEAEDEWVHERRLPDWVKDERAARDAWE